MSAKNLEFLSQYILKILIWQKLIATTRPNTNTFHIWANLIRTLTNSNKGKMHDSSNRICKSHKCSQLNFAWWFVKLSIAIFTNKVMYSTKTLSARFNIEIHLVFTLWIILSPCVSMTSASFVNSKCRLKDVQSRHVKFVTNFKCTSPKVNLIRSTQLDLCDGPYNRPQWN